MRLEVIADFREEGWPSMDLAAEMLVSAANALPEVQSVLTRPQMWRARPASTNPRGFERALGRFVQYPLRLLARSHQARYFHIADHSYGHLAHVLPRRRTGIYCHDLDAFRDVLDGGQRPASRRALAGLLLSGLRRAAVVFFSTDDVRQQLLAERVVDPARLVHAPFGIAPEYTPQPSKWDASLEAPFLLNVGSCIPRKNIPFLLQLFAALRKEQPELRLIQVGGSWTSEQQALLQTLGLEQAVIQRRGLSRDELAAHYRRARAVLLPTTKEGFGLPLTEALACGATVLASRLSVLVEVGGDAAHFASVNQLPEWLSQLRAMANGSLRADPARCSLQAARYSWAEHARIVVDAYRGLGYSTTAS